ncbi:MAG: Ig-like domain-containing protein [Clostridia bacterium]|nr:Ig-like domain-containing protein [Clostridia bacterium]
MRKGLVILALTLAVLLTGIVPAGATEAGVTIGVSAASKEPEVTVTVNTGKLPVLDSADPLVSDILAQAGQTETLPVLLLQVRKSADLRATVLPKTVKNKKVAMTASNGEVLQVKGMRMTGLAAGVSELTVASEEDPAAAQRFLVAVIQPVAHIQITAEAKTVAVGESIKLAGAITPEGASIPAIEWLSADERIATVNADGVVTGVKKGSVRISAKALDGSNARSNINVTVTQNAESITLDKTELTVHAGKSAMLKGTVLPKDANDKGIFWSSSDESVATVNQQGRVTGVALGECEVIATSKGMGSAVQARATVHVQQPVQKVTFGEAPTVYAGESAKLSWTVEPANASNQTLTFASGNKKVLTVDEDGNVFGLKAGETYVNAASTDGTNRRARIKVKVLQHVTGVHMTRKVAYISKGETATTGAQLEPKDASNNNIIWESADPSIASIQSANKKGTGNRAKITGVSRGETTVTATTEEGGFQATMRVRIGDWDNSLRLTDAYVEGADQRLTVRNVSDLYITSVTAEVSVFDVDGNPVSANSKDGSNTFKMVYRHELAPGASTRQSGWKYVDFKLPESMTVATYEVTVTQFQIDGDWVKTIRKKYQPQMRCPVHI